MTLVIFMTGGHFAAKAIIGGQQSRQLEELADVALRRSEIAVAFGATILEELASRGSINCDPASLQAFRFSVYQRSAVKDIRLLNRDGSVLCSAYSETLEFDNGLVDRPNMSRSSDQRLLLFRVDRFNAAALGVLRELGDGQSLVAILDLNSDLFDIMPAELRTHSEVLLELGDGSELGRFSLKGREEFSQLVELRKVSSSYPLQATIRVERSELWLWHNEAYWPAMLIALGLGLVFGLLVTRATAKLEGPVVDIDHGLARCEFKPFFQPIFDLRTGDILGCEALARWVREDGTIVPPMSFIPLVESSGRIEA